MTVMFNESELMRYARQVLLDDWGVDAQLRLKASTVLIVGAGGLGCPVAVTLARAGVGNLHILDDDVIEPSNLQRQSVFFDGDVGQYKAKVLAERLTEHNPHINLHSKVARLDANSAALITAAAPDLILDCTDNFATRDSINALAMKARLPLLSAAAIGEVGQLALFERQTGCYHCVFGDDKSSDNRNCADSGVLASTTAIMGNLQAQAALKFLGQGVNPIVGRLMVWHGASFQLRAFTFDKSADCPICND